MTRLLEVDGLDVVLDTARGEARAVRGVSFTLDRGETLGIVGESGCGKTMTALALMGLLPDNARARGAVRLDGENLLERSEARWCRIRGDRVAMVFQEPMSSLNPLHPVGRQVAESIVVHRGATAREARREAVRLLELVGIEDAERRARDHPHRFSGGQRQRVMIAMALANQPDLLIADEPTTALDVTIQKQILELIERLSRELGMALVLISHDLAVVAHAVQRILVMYGGTVVESAPTRELFARLAHPYTQGLLAGIPRLEGSRGERRLQAIPGTVPELADLPEGCTFADRCALAADACRRGAPALEAVGEGHAAACLRLDMARRQRQGSTAP